MSTKTNKKVMYLNGDHTKPIMGSGVLIYKNEDGKMKILILDTKHKYEDIGGNIYRTDSTLYDAICREIEKETNGIIKKTDIFNRIQKAKYIYIPKAKYLVFLLEATVTEKKLKKQDFGDKELHNNYNRDIGWINRQQLSNKIIFKYKLNNRLKNKILFDTLQIIENQFKYTKRMFPL
jgi:hypothetical protein